MFTLDPRLQNDTITLGQFALCQLLLMNDKRYPWFILVPKRERVVEFFDLNESDQMQLWAEVSTLNQLLAPTFRADKMNVANLGNVVSQLHIHVIVRYSTDEAWPSPVWGKGTAIPYHESDIAVIKAKLADVLPSDFCWGKQV